jgi:hypothetical protein
MAIRNGSTALELKIEAQSYESGRPNVNTSSSGDLRSIEAGAR